MVSGFNQLATRIIPVVAHTKQKAIPIVVPKPEVGIRWGKPSRFEFSNEGAKDKGNPIGVVFLAQKQTIKGTEVYRKWEKVKAVANSTVSGVQIPTMSFEFERPKEMFFFVKETEEREETRREIGDGAVSIQPKITTVYHYIKLAYPLNDPEDEVTASGERGEHPDKTLAKTQAEFDATLLGTSQKIKEYWEGVFEDVRTWSKPSWLGGPGAG